MVEVSTVLSPGTPHGSLLEYVCHWENKKSVLFVHGHNNDYMCTLLDSFRKEAKARVGF